MTNVLSKVCCHELKLVSLEVETIVCIFVNGNFDLSGTVNCLFCCSLPFDQYEALTPTEQHDFEKGIEAGQHWLKLSFDVCHICQGCHLTVMRKTLVEFAHKNERRRKSIFGSCANNPKKNTTQNN
jgi:hypothetical protein